MKPSKSEIRIRTIQTEDYLYFIPKVNNWWGGRDIAHLIQRYHFVYFQSTSFAAERESTPVGFLIGFISNKSDDQVAYIHFVGVDPSERDAHIGRKLYEHFFDEVRNKGCHKVRCVTSPVNHGSIAFHKAMGFKMEPGQKIVNGIPVHVNDDGHGGMHVCFVKAI